MQQFCRRLEWKASWSCPCSSPFGKAWDVSRIRARIWDVGENLGSRQRQSCLWKYLRIVHLLEHLGLEDNLTSSQAERVNNGVISVWNWRRGLWVFSGQAKLRYFWESKDYLFLEDLRDGSVKYSLLFSSAKCTILFGLYKSSFELYLTIFQTIWYYTELLGKPVLGCYQNEPLLFDGGGVIDLVVENVWNNHKCASST